MAKLYQVTGDDDQRAPEDVMRAIVKASVRAKEPAMRDMATWLGKRLATDHCGAKVKVLRLIIMIISHCALSVMRPVPLSRPSSTWAR